MFLDTCNNIRIDKFSFRESVITREVAGSQDSKPITVTACTAYDAHPFKARDAYEVIALKKVPSLPPARAGNPTSPWQRSGQYENVPARSAQGHELECSSVATPTPLLSTKKSSYNRELYYEPVSATFSAATSTTTSPQDTEYDMPM